MAPPVGDGHGDASHGVLDPHDINNVGFFVLFALIGVGFVVTGIWFFFWARNGGFHFRQTDWDDYKSTVLRRKGPNDTLLSAATAELLPRQKPIRKVYSTADRNATREAERVRAEARLQLPAAGRRGQRGQREPARGQRARHQELPPPDAGAARARPAARGVAGAAGGRSWSDGACLSEHGSRGCRRG